MKESKGRSGLSALVDDDYYTIASRLRRLAGQCDGTLRDVDGNMRWDRLSRLVAGGFAIARSTPQHRGRAASR
jgi:hypothetical protein